MTAPKLCLLLFLTGGLCKALAAAPATEAGNPDAAGEDTPWVDSSHSYIVSGADNIAEWMNDFFGDVRTEEDAPYSTLRLRFEQEWDEANQFDSDIKLRGKVYLPQFNERLSLLFSDEDTGETGRDDLLIDRQDTPEDVSLQYKAKEQERYRIDFRVGLRSSLNLKSSVRYKYEYPLQKDLIGTFSEEVLYLGGDGFASKTRVELDKIISENLLLQWHNKVDWQENEDGIFWNSSLSLDRKISEKKAFGYFAGVDGQTQPNSLITTYALGVRYRQNAFRPWFFFEIQPSYRWFKYTVEDDREGAAVILFRAEMVFHRDLSR